MAQIGAGFLALPTRSFRSLMKQSDPIQAAFDLTSAAKILATGSYAELLDILPGLEAIDTDKWDLFLTAAGIFVAISSLNSEDIPEDEANRIAEEIARAATDIHPDIVSACQDCKEFYDQTYDTVKSSVPGSQHASSDIIGAWVVRNLLGHLPSSEEERSMARKIGVLVVPSFVSWWK